MIEKWRSIKYVMDVTAGENAMVTEDRQAAQRQTVQGTSHGWRSRVKEGGMMLYGVVFHRRRPWLYRERSDMRQQYHMQGAIISPGLNLQRSSGLYGK